MKLSKKITAGIAKVSEIVIMLMIALLVLVIVAELCNRNFLGSSFRPTIEICGIAFLWMAFIGLIPLYENEGLMRLDFLLAKTKGKVADTLYIVNKVFSLLLGVVMVIAFIAQYPFISTRTYATFSFPLPYTIQYVPMAIAGAFIALKSVEQLVDRVIRMAKKD